MEAPRFHRVRGISSPSPTRRNGLSSNVPTSSDVKAITFSGLPFRGKPTRVFAWLGIPKLENGQKAPAMVLIHGGGGTAFDEWVRLWIKRGYAAIAMDTCGQVPVGTYGKWYRRRAGRPAGLGRPRPDRSPREDQWTYHAVADAILAHSLIRSLPEVDPERTGVTGISWGGYLTCIVAGVDHRFRLAVPVYGCGYYRDTIFGERAQQTHSRRCRAMARWWDPSVYLPDAEMPMLWVTGSNDFAYTFNALQKSYRLPKGPARSAFASACRTGTAARGRTPRKSASSPTTSWARARRSRGLKKPVVTVPASGPPSQHRSPDHQSRTELHARHRPLAGPEMGGDCRAARPRARVTATLPEGTRVYYFNLFDQRDCVVSTEHQE